jgi:glutamine synthetase
MHATFLAKPMTEEAGSAMHIHQSVVNIDDGRNIFSTKAGGPSDLFFSYIGGLQKYMLDAQLIFAPYVNSYRRFLDAWDSPINLAWAVDNRTVGLRVPDSDANSRRVENRLAGSDVNSYLATAATLACGYLGMEEGLKASDPIKGSAYDIPFSLHPHIYESISAMKNSDALRRTLGDEFITMYCAVKETEYLEFHSIITPWEREILMFNV